MEIRAARPDDWLQIWPFFRDIVTEGETYAYPDDITAEQAQDLWTPGPDGFTAVAMDGDEVMGVALMQPNRPGRGSHVATASFMVSPAARGHGVGRRLGEYGDGPRTPGSGRCSSTPLSRPTRQRSDSGSHSGSTRLASSLRLSTPQRMGWSGFG